MEDLQVRFDWGPATGYTGYWLYHRNGTKLARLIPKEVTWYYAKDLDCYGFKDGLYLYDYKINVIAALKVKTWKKP